MAAIVAVVVLILVLSAAHLLPQLRNPFAQTTTVSSQPVILKSITELSRYEAASGSFQVVVDLTKRRLLPSFLAGSETLFIGQGTDIAYVDFARLKSRAITMYANRSGYGHAAEGAAGTGRAQRTSPTSSPSSRVCSTAIGNFFSGNPNSQQQAYILPSKDRDRGAAEPPARRSAEEHRGHAGRHADLARLQPRHRHVRLD